VIDASSGRIIQEGKVDGEPDRISFSEGFAYLRRRSSPMLRAIPLSGLGFAGRELPQIELPMGSGPLGRFPFSTPADSIVPVPGGSAMLVVNCEDRSVHYYKEGMSAPMGSFRLRNGAPRAVLTVDRSLQERHSPGFYETVAQLPEAAAYKVVVFLDSPRLTHTFRLRTAADPALARGRATDALDVVFPDPPRRLRVGESAALRFRVDDRTARAPRAGLNDLRVQTVLVPGIWSDRQAAEPKPGGWYEVRFRPVRAGVYYLFFESESGGLVADAAHRHILYVEGGDAGRGTAKGSSPE
jgi:hypothetical protein